MISLEAVALTHPVPVDWLSNIVIIYRVEMFMIEDYLIISSEKLHSSLSTYNMTKSNCCKRT